MKKYLPIFLLLFSMNSKAQRNAGGSAEDVIIDAALTNYPNSFSGHTTILYRIPEDGTVILKTYNSAGQLVFKDNQGYRKPGYYRIDFYSSSLPNGNYVCRMEYFSGKGSKVLTRKMQILK